MPYYLHVMDLYPDLFVQSGIVRDGVISRLIERYSVAAFSGADRIVVIGRCMQGFMLNKGIDPDKVRIVENWPESTLADDRYSGGGFRERHGLKNKFIVMYSGNMGRFHTFQTILEVARRFETRPDVVFVFVGSGVRRKEVEKAATTATNLFLFDYQPVELLGDMLAAADVHFISLAQSATGLMVPSKFYGVLAAGRPVVYEGSVNSELARVIQEEGCGGIVPEGESETLERCLTEYIQNPDLASSHGRRSRLAYENRFEREHLADRYAEIILN